MTLLRKPPTSGATILRLWLRQRSASLKRAALGAWTLFPAGPYAGDARRQAFDRAGWVFELKYDGFRVMAIQHGEEVRVLSRRGNDLLPCFPEIADCLRQLPDLVLDGELVVLDD